MCPASETGNEGTGESEHRVVRSCPDRSRPRDPARGFDPPEWSTAMLGPPVRLRSTRPWRACRHWKRDGLAPERTEAGDSVLGLAGALVAVSDAGHIRFLRREARLTSRR